jgi:hypothetical protein
VAQRELHHFRQVNGPASCCLDYLFAATKSVGDDQRVGFCPSHSGEKYSFSYGLRDCQLLFFKTEWASHSATSGIERLQGGPHLSEQRLFVFHFHECFVMAMTVKNHFSMKLRWFIARSVMFQKFAEEECLSPKSIGAHVIRKQVSQLITEYGGTTRLQDYDRQAGVDLPSQALQDALEILFGFV